MKVFSFILNTFVTLSVWGQGLVSPNQAIVKASIEQSVVITCSGYTLQDSTGQRYGRNNRTEFSQVYSLAVVTDSGLIVPASLSFPWTCDADFKRYRSSYNPILNSIRFRQLGDSIYSSLQLAVDSTSSPLLFRMSKDSVEKVPQLSIHSDSTYNNGWLLWVYASDTLGNVGLTSTTAVAAPSNISDTIPSIPVNAPLASGLMHDSTASRKPIGAAWVVPCYPQPGLVQFRVAGLTVRDSEGWLLIPIRFASAEITETQSEVSGEELTPSPKPQQSSGKKNKKNKKNK